MLCRHVTLIDLRELKSISRSLQLLRILAVRLLQIGMTATLRVTLQRSGARGTTHIYYRSLACH